MEQRLLVADGWYDMIGKEGATARKGLQLRAAHYYWLVAPDLDGLEKAKTESQGLGLFARSLVGMDRQAAKNALGAFLSGGTLRANQIQFLNNNRQNRLDVRWLRHSVDGVVVLKCTMRTNYKTYSFS